MHRLTIYWIILNFVETDLIMEIIILYYIFSVLFMVGYINLDSMNTWLIIGTYLLMLIIAPILFPIIVGYYFNKNT